MGYIACIVIFALVYFFVMRRPVEYEEPSCNNCYYQNNEDDWCDGCIAPLGYPPSGYAPMEIKNGKA